MLPANDAATLVGGKASVVVGHLPETPVARYEEIEEISRGGCGVVIRAYDKRLRCEVALKRILPELAAHPTIKSRFFHEARVTARLAHPGIAPIHDMSDESAVATPFYTMKWLRGQTLADVINSHHNNPRAKKSARGLREMMIRFRQVCQTLSYAHQQGVVHRDLKPSNILIGQFGETVVLDWGLAKELNSLSNQIDASFTPEASQTSLDNSPVFHKEESTSDLTQAGAVLGTACYMSPEQAAGQSHLVDRRADVFSLGVILYEILSGSSPFRCPTSQETMQHVIRCEYKPLSQYRPRIAKSIAAVCERALSLDPNARYADAGEMERDVQAWLAGDCVSAYSEPWWATLDRMATKYRTLFWSVLISLFCVTAITSTSTIAISNAHRNEKHARIAAENAHNQVNQSLAREKLAHQEAVTQLQQARASIDGWLLGLDSVLALYPGLSPLRDQLFHQAIDYYSVLAEQPAQSDTMKLEVARAKIRLADLEQMNGRSQDALQNYREAVTSLRTYPPEQSDWQIIANLQQAAALLGISQIDLLEHRLEHVQEHLDQAFNLCDPIPEVSAQYSEACELKAKTLRLEASLVRHAGQFSHAQRLIRQAITLYETHVLPVELMHSNTQQRQTFLAMLDDLASILIDAHDYSAANESLQRMIHYYDRLLEMEANRADWLEARALVRLRAGNCYVQLVEPNQAVAQLEAAEDDLQNAWQLFKGEHTYIEKLSLIHNALGHSYFVNGDLDQAQQLLTRCLGHAANKFDAQQPSESLLAWIQTRLYLATILLRRGTPDLNVLNDVEEAIATLSSRDLLNDSAIQSRAQFAWLKSQALTDQTASEKAQLLLAESIARHSSVPHEYRNAAWSFWLGRLYAAKARIEHRSSHDTESQESMAKACASWQAAYDAQDKRWTVHAAFELFESWLHNDVMDSERLKLAHTMASEIIEDHKALPTGWFWLAELAYHQGDFELAARAQEKLERLRHHETVEDRLLKALIQKDEPLAVELMNVHCLQGSHAEWLQQKLRQTIHGVPEAAETK